MADRKISDPGVYLIRRLTGRQVVTITEDSRVVFEGLVESATISTDDRNIKTATLALINED